MLFTQLPLIVEVRPESPVAAGCSMYTLTYLSQGLRVKGLLAIPYGQGPFPALLYCRGGLGRIGKVNPLRIAQLAAFGYIVFAPHYRGGEGGEGRDEFGGADRHDVYAAYQVLKDIPCVIPERISVLGFSRGGMMALLAAMECRGLRAAVVWNGVSDLFLTYEERVDLRRMLRRVVGHPRKNREAYLMRSPVYHAEKIACPVLVIHGVEDQNVGVGHANKLADALQSLGKPCEVWLAEGAGHLFDKEEMETYTRRMFAWLEKGENCY